MVGYMSSGNNNGRYNAESLSIALIPITKSGVSYLSNKTGATSVNYIDLLELADLENCKVEHDKLNADTSSVIDSFKIFNDIVVNDTIDLSGQIDDQNQYAAETMEIDSKNYKNHLNTLKYGSYKKQYYYASNGIVLEYYIYMPDYGVEVDGLPVHVYLHGSGEVGNGVNTQSLPKLIKDEKITPEGIVLSIQAKSNSDYYVGNYEDAIVELAIKVAEDNNGDKNKISLSGHSMGAVTGYKIIARHPDIFSAFVPVSGRPSELDILANSGTKVWFFHGQNDNRCNYDETLTAYEELKEQGKDVDMYTIQDGGHTIQNEVFGGKFTSSVGEMIDPLTWAMNQTRDKSPL